MLSVVAVALISMMSQSQNAADSPPPTVTAPVKEKRICRSEATIGSLINRRTCHTAAEWHRIDEQNADNADRALNARNRANSGLGR